MDDLTYFSKVLKMGSKDFFVDLKENRNGKYLKVSERRDGNRKSILVPIFGIANLVASLNEVLDVIEGSPWKTVESTVVFVHGFPLGTSNEVIAQFMSSAGDVVKVNTLKARPKAEVESSIVEFADVATAQSAIETLNGTEFDGWVINVRENRENRPQNSSAAAAAKENVAAKDSASAPSGKKKRAAKKKFRSQEQNAQQAAAEGQAAAETPVQSKIPEPNKIYCGNLSFDTTSEELENYFSTTGHVVNVDLKTKRNGKSLGYALVEFANPLSVGNAITQCNDQVLNGRPLNVRAYFTN